MKSSFLPKYERKIVRISALLSMAQYRAEILTIFGSYFGRNDDFKNSFWNLLTFTFAFVFLVSSQRRGTVMELNVEQVKVNRGVSSFSLTENYWCQQVCHLALFYSNINFHEFKATFDVSWSYVFKVDLKRSYWIRLLWIVESAFYLDLRQNLIHFNFNPNLLKVFKLNYF